MSTTTDLTVAALDRPTRPGSLTLATITSGVISAGAVVALAAVWRGGGVQLAAGGDIPLPGFATVTLFAAMVGGLIAAAFRRGSATRHFFQTTVVLAALSCLLPLFMAPGVAGKLALISTHLVAAAIIIPVLARRIAS